MYCLGSFNERVVLSFRAHLDNKAVVVEPGQGEMSPQLEVDFAI